MVQGVSSLAVTGSDTPVQLTSWYLPLAASSDMELCPAAKTILAVLGARAQAGTRLTQ